LAEAGKLIFEREDLGLVSKRGLFAYVTMRAAVFEAKASARTVERYRRLAEEMGMVSGQFSAEVRVGSALGGRSD
jgi:hypothetical protein